VQGVYLLLAVLMGGGLVLFGVGAGNGFGGLLNAFTGGSGSNSGKPVVSQSEKSALRQTQLTPNDPQAWAALVRARDEAAKQGTTLDKRQLAAETQAWQRYLQLTKHPDPTVAILVARAYGALGNYANAASAWELETVADPGQAKGYECLAVAAYAAKQNRKGDLASAKALSLVPKLQRSLLRRQIQQAKTQPQLAQQC